MTRIGLEKIEVARRLDEYPEHMTLRLTEVVPALVEVEVAVPHLSPAIW